MAHKYPLPNLVVNTITWDQPLFFDPFLIVNSSGLSSELCKFGGLAEIRKPSWMRMLE